MIGAEQIEALPSFIGPYRVLSKLGEGGMGVVYEALHETIARRVAIKLLSRECAHNPDVIQRFFNEARATNLIDHPSLAQVSDLGQLADGRAYIVMELLKGDSLSKRLRRLGGRMPVTQTVRLAWQIAEALAAAHRAGIIHRDLKPDNIMVVPDPVAPGGERAKILDFGIAKLAAGGPVKTSQGLLMGTPRYMSPEQCRGAAEVDAKTDVYSLGVMLFEMLAGQPPFEGEGSGDLLIMHVTQEPPSLLRLAPDLPVSLSKLIHLLLTKDRTARPAMTEVVCELAMLGANTSSDGTVPRTEPSGSRPADSSVLFSGAATVSTRSHAAAQVQAKRPASAAQRAKFLVSAGVAIMLLFLGMRSFRIPQHAASAQYAVPLAKVKPQPIRQLPAPAVTEVVVTPASPSVDVRPPSDTPSPPLVQPTLPAAQPTKSERRDSRRHRSVNQFNALSHDSRAMSRPATRPVPPPSGQKPAVPSGSPAKDIYIAD